MMRKKLGNLLMKRLMLILSCPSLNFIKAQVLLGMDFTNLKQYSLSKWFQLSQIALNRWALVDTEIYFMKRKCSTIKERMFCIYLLLTGPVEIPWNQKKKNQIFLSFNKKDTSSPEL